VYGRRQCRCYATSFRGQDARRFEGSEKPSKFDANIVHENRIDLMVNKRIDFNDAITEIATFAANPFNKFFHIPSFRLVVIDYPALTGLSPADLRMISNLHPDIRIL
jgi:hypothetical protein